VTGPDTAAVARLLEQYEVRPSKRLGQNFLVDPSVCPRMAAACGADKDTAVLEIGPGAGALTLELAKTAGKVLAVEVDPRLADLLDGILPEGGNVEIIRADIMATDVRALLEEKAAGMRALVCANLPYSITTPVIMKLLESRAPVESLTLMVQKDAAARLCARVGERLAGAVTVAVDYYASARCLFDVPAAAFYPAPKVDSTVIRLDIRQKPPVEVADEAGFFRFVAAAFAQRRKTAVNAVSAGLALPKEAVARAVAEAGFEPLVRAEALDMQSLARLYAALGTCLQPGSPA